MHDTLQLLGDHFLVFLIQLAAWPVALEFRRAPKFGYADNNTALLKGQSTHTLYDLFSNITVLVFNEPVHGKLVHHF